MLKLMITAIASNSGKTAVTCGLLSLLKRKGFDPCAFKCGPDYIDPMFHRTVLGIPSSNLDVFLAGEEGVKRTFARGCAGVRSSADAAKEDRAEPHAHGAAICEGVMGYYDGITGSSAAASAWHVARLLELPAILVLRPKGAALTLAAVVKGMVEFQPELSEVTDTVKSGEGTEQETPDEKAAMPSAACGNDLQGGQIRGVILNDCSEMYYKTYGSVIEKASGIPVLGYLPHMEEAVFESRHLGLMTAEEIRDLGERIDRIGARMEETIDLQRLLSVMGNEADSIEMTPDGNQDGCQTDGDQDNCQKDRNRDYGQADGNQYNHETETDPVRIAVAKDAAFNFIYAESIAALEQAGGEIVYFSPLEDACLPEDIHGIYLPGGYPELYGKRLSENVSMRESIRGALNSGIPTIAECGGFLYLSESLEDADCNIWPMADVLPGHAAGTGKLVRFGYGHIGCDRDSMLFRSGEQIPAHEFHYWDTTQPGSDLTLTKNSNGRQWQFGYATDTLYAGFPHLYLAGNHLAERFVQAAGASIGED